MDERIRILFIISVFLSGLVMIVAHFKMRDYVVKRNLMPLWKLKAGFMIPFNLWSAYINNTKKEYGRVGLWFKIYAVSFLLFVITVFGGIFVLDL